MSKQQKKCWFFLANFFRNNLLFFSKWLILSLVVATLIGIASAFFLISLNWVTNFRTNHIWLIYLLPIGGLAIGFAYHYIGSNIASGNNLLADAIHGQHKKIPIKLGIFIYLSTLITHLFGGSAGREGTALQMATSIADQLSKPFKLNQQDRKTLLIAAIAGGFGAVFGTPLAGAVFALEVFLIGKLSYQDIVFAFLTATIADFICQKTGATHNHYQIDHIPKLSLLNTIYTIIAGVAFGLTAYCFSKTLHLLSIKVKATVSYPPLRPFFGGFVIIFLFYILGTSKYLGLGIPTIIASFQDHLNVDDFALKALFTVITLASGFKGGEVTPLFFIGAALGNTLALFIPLPIALLAGMGFVAVFAGATNTPLACMVMALELFGFPAFCYMAIACSVAFLCSGQITIYDHLKINQIKFEKYRGLFRDETD